MEQPGATDDIEDDEIEETHPEVSRADDPDVELTIGEIMDLEPQKMVMNSSEKILNRFYEGALGPVENVTAFFETTKVNKQTNKQTNKTKQNKTKQNKTKQNKTKQSKNKNKTKTKQHKTKTKQNKSKHGKIVS